MGPSEHIPPRLRQLALDLAAAAEQEPKIRAAWLEGSIATGTADDWSDLDLHLLVTSGPAFEAVEWVRRVRSLVLADAIPGVTGAFICITPDWLHVDVIVHESEARLDPCTPRLVLTDNAAAVPTGAPSEASVRCAPYFPHDVVSIFVYRLGEAATDLRRNDLIGLTRLTGQLRDGLVSLLLAHNGVPVAQVRKCAERFLAADQRALVASLPAVSLSAQSLAAFVAATAAAFTAAARELAAICDAEWPDPFFQATRSFVRETAGIDL